MAKSNMRAYRDPLTEVLDVFPLPLRFAGNFTLTAPWGVSIPERSALFCAVTRGSCWLTGDSLGPPRPLSSGDILLLSPVCEHQLRDELDGSVVPIDELIASSDRERQTSLSHGGGGVRSQLIGGLLEFNGCAIHPLCSALPPVLHMTLKDTEQATEMSEIFRAIERELSARRPGGESIVHRLSEVLIIQMARLCLAQGEGINSGVMKGMVHRDLGPALTCIHRQPERPWTVASLAEQANMSRSSFSASFTQVLEIPPLQYLREHRMRTASRLLQDSSLGLKEVASRVGYDSVSAFSMAFKRFSGQSPGEYRRRSPLASSL
jgi:AraC-like DNA-binding protein